jgi:hypothetical protein
MHGRDIPAHWGTQPSRPSFVSADLLFAPIPVAVTA